MNMKCIYAVPSEAADTARSLCLEYAKALELCSDAAVAKGDDLREFVENAGGPVLQLDDEDWDTARASISCGASEGQRELGGEIFWSKDEAKSAAAALGADAAPASQSAANWLLAQVGRGRSVVLLAR
jgi:hypothetical protein